MRKLLFGVIAAAVLVVLAAPAHARSAGSKPATAHPVGTESREITAADKKKPGASDDDLVTGSVKKRKPTQPKPDR